MSPTSEGTVQITLNLLTFIEADEELMLAKGDQKPTCNDILKFLSTLESPSIDEIVGRYRELAGEEMKQLQILPAERRILHKIVLPLRAAMGSYMVGNYLGTIAICGAVCEMITILWYDLAKVRSKDAVMDETTQKRIYGDKFEKLYQTRRISVMRGVGLIDEDTERLLRIPLSIRSKHLHHFSEPHENAKDDARAVWQATRDLMAKVFKARFKNGKVVLDKTLLDYLRETSNAEEAE